MFTPGSRACAYRTASGRAKWPNRDPIGEAGGINLYHFNFNDALNRIDLDGLQSYQLNPQTAKLALELEAEELGITVQQLVARKAAEKLAKEAAEKAAKELAKRCKKLSNSQIKELQKRNIDPHDLKPNSKFDLFYDPKTREIFVKPKSGTGPGDPTGIFVP